MPIINSTYQPTRRWLRNAHVSSITPAILRTVKGVDYNREVLELDDGDFLDLDWFCPDGDNGKLVLVLHGLEGAADRPYVRGICRYFGERGWHALALNQRTCGGRMNRLLRGYHMGATDDVARVINYAISKGYQQVGIVGFSMGGNHVMKYLGETGTATPSEVIGGVAISVPCHIVSANVELVKLKNRLYLSRFLLGLNDKMRQKARKFPDQVDVSGRMPRNFAEFDERFTAPLHGFDGAIDYWTKCSSRQFIPGIVKPTLLINSLNDTFLSDQCFPREEATEMDHFFLEMPKYGGHCGYGSGREYWSEKRAFEFLAGLVE